MFDGAENYSTSCETEDMFLVLFSARFFDCIPGFLCRFAGIVVSSIVSLSLPSVLEEI